MEDVSELEDYTRRHEFLLDFAYITGTLSSGELPYSGGEFDYILLLGKGGYALIDASEPTFNVALDFIPYSVDETIDDIIEIIVRESQEDIKIYLPDTDCIKNIPFYERMAEKIQLAMLLPPLE